MPLDIDKIDRLKLHIEEREVAVASATYRLNKSKADLKSAKAALKTAEKEK